MRPPLCPPVLSGTSAYRFLPGEVRACPTRSTTPVLRCLQGAGGTQCVSQRSPRGAGAGGEATYGAYVIS